MMMMMAAATSAGDTTTTAVTTSQDQNQNAATGPSSSAPSSSLTQQQKVEMLADEDPLLISQSLTYVTDDGSTLQSFQSEPYSLSFKIQFILLETIFVVLMVAAVPVGAHATVVTVIVANLILLAWFWYNLVRSVDVTADGTLRFWIGNIEVDVPFDKIVSIRRVATSMPCSMFVTTSPYRGFLSNPLDGVAITTTVPSTPFWLWPRSAGKPDRSCCFGVLSCPRLTVVFSPAGGGLNFIREVENEMRNFSGKPNHNPSSSHHTSSGRATNPDYLDV